MSAARTATLTLRLQSVKRELYGALKERARLKANADELRALATEQESATNALSYRQATLPVLAKVQHYDRAIRDLCEQEKALERELSAAEFLGRISADQCSAVDETMGAAA